MYTDKNFKTKAQLKAAVQAWNQAQLIPQGAPAHYERPHAAAVTYHQPGPFGGNEPRDGTIYVEGPHYPAPHRWYAACIVKGGVIVKVK